MNLLKLFDMQRELDAKIIKEKGLEDMDRLPYLILALQVELGECANEWRGFKYWSKDRDPRTERRAYADERKLSYTVVGNPLLEEYVDCLHFILSIGLHLQMQELAEKTKENFAGCKPLEMFGELFYRISDLDANYTHDFGRVSDGCYNDLISAFYALGESLGFTWEEIEDAYLTKNAVNHQRQANGY